MAAMSDSKIPPRPWRLDDVYGIDRPEVMDAAGSEVFFVTQDSRIDTSQETLALIVRLVNAEAEVVAALEAAEHEIDEALAHSPTHEQSLSLVRAALAKVSG